MNKTGLQPSCVLDKLEKTPKQSSYVLDEPEKTKKYKKKKLKPFVFFSISSGKL